MLQFLLLLALAAVPCCCRLQGGAPRALLQADPHIPSSCSAGFEQALKRCMDATLRLPGSPCCQGLAGLGGDCLGMAAAGLMSQNQVDQIVQACDLGSGSSSNGADLVNGTDPLPLPEGEVLTWWRWRGDSVVCADYRGGRFVNATAPAPNWVATGADMPPDEELISLGERWCRSQDAAVDDIFAALEAGGQAAQAAQAAVALYKCGDGATLWDALSSRLIGDPRLAGPEALGYMRAFVAAADRNGINFCITAVVVSNITGAVLYKEAIHVGPTPDSPKGCPPAFQQLRAFCGAYAAAPPGYCCDELAALGTVCQASLASGLGGDDLAVFSELVRACSESPGTDAPPLPGNLAPAPGPGPAIPAGTSTLQLNTGATAACSAYDSATGWSELGNSSWTAARADLKPAAADIEAFARQMCPLAGAAGPLLLRAVEAGGQRARVAAACIVAAVNPGTCSNETARAAARAAFLQAVVDLDDPERQLGVMQAFVGVCDTMGAGACASLAVYRPDDGQVLYQTWEHTSVDASPAAASAPAVARRLLRCRPPLPPGQTMLEAVLGGCLA